MGSRFFGGSGPAANMQKAYTKNVLLSSTLYCKVLPSGLLLGPSRITPQNSVPTDPEHIQKHVNAVAKHIHFRRRRVSPSHGNFYGAKPVMPRQIEQFRIEPEPLDALLLEEDVAFFAPERFEPALRVHERQAQDHSHDRVEDDSGEFAET